MIIITSIILIAAFLLYMFWNKGLIAFPRKLQQSKQLLLNGLEAPAILLSMYSSGDGNNEMAEYTLQVQVQPVEGRNFVTEIKQIISSGDLGKLQIGTTLYVKYDPLNKKKLALIFS